MFNYDNFTCLEYRVRHQEKRIRELESGEAFAKMKKGQEHTRKYYEGKISKLRRELECSHEEAVRSREKWFEVFQDMQDECGKRLSETARQLGRTEQRVRELEQENAALKAKLRKSMDDIVDTRAQVQDEKEKNQKLQAQIRQNYQNSSVPSSKDPFRTKVPNNRERTGRRPGGQPGHEGHRRRSAGLEPNRRVFLPAPEEIEANPDYYRRSGAHAEVHKLVVGIRIGLDVTDYWAYRYRNRRTGAKYQPPFPEGVRLEVNYDESIKAMAFLMKNRLNVSEENIREFLYELSGGKLQISRGMVNGLTREFAGKTEAERKAEFKRLATGHVLYTDMTGARRNGKLKNIVVCTNGMDTMYFFRDTKGDKAMEGTPAEIFTDVLVHDHDRTMYHYGGKHQECNEHHLRYLKGAQENEPQLTWHGEMRLLLKEMNRVREEQGRDLSPEQIEDFETRYDRILDLADQEYEDNPPGKYYRKGYNLSVELRKYRKEVLLFLHDPEVDFTNNKSERGCRKAKRHLAVSGTFRGETNRSGEEYCDALSVLETIRGQKGNVYKEVAEIFRRQKPGEISSGKTGLS